MQMQKWIEIVSFTYPHDAHIAKGHLESEGFLVKMTDELTAQVNPFYSNAIGGVKLHVQESDFEKARKILIESGQIIENADDSTDFFAKFDILTSKLPLIGTLSTEIRLFVLAAVFLILLIVPIVFFTLP